MTKINHNSIYSVLAISLFGFLMISGLFFWYKSFAYYTHNIYTYHVEETNEIADNGRELAFSVSRINQYYRTVVTNHSPTDITAEIHNGTDSSVLLIESGEEIDFANTGSDCRIIIFGESITEENVIISASTIPYLRKYRQAVIITLAAAVVLTAIWDLLILFVPDLIRNHGAKINTAITILFSAACIFSHIVFYRGYYETCFFFIALQCAIFATLFRKKEHTAQKEHPSISTDDIFLTAGIFSLLFSCLLFSLMLNSTETSPFYFFNSRNKMSLPDYVITVLLFFLLFFLLCSVLSKRTQFMLRIKNCFSDNTALPVCGTVVTASLFILQDELEIPEHPVRFSLCLFLFGTIIFFYRKKVFSKIQHNISVYLVYFVTVGMTAVSTTVINYFHMGKETDSLVMHIDCYYRPIYYMVNNLPVPEHLNSYYGHYPLFYYLPLKLFGANLLTVGIMTGIIGGLTALFSIGILHRLTKSNILRIAGSIAIMNILCSGIYLAIVPHRLIFPMMLLFFIVHFTDKNIRLLQIISGSIISFLSIVWNMETGLVVLCIWILFLVLKKASGKNNCIKYVLKTTTTLILITITAALIILIGFIFFRSHISNTSLSAVLSDLFGVLLNADYMLNEHFNFIRLTNSPWLYIMILFLSAAAYGMCHMGFFSISIDREQTMPALISIAAMGLGLMVYFISRPEDYNIIILPAIFLTIYFLDHISTTKINRLLCKVLLLGLCCILVHTADTVESLLSRVMSRHQLDYSLLLDDLHAFANEVPEESTASGHGLPEIYMNLGWKIPEDNNTPEYLISSNSNPNNENYILEKEILFGDKIYYLYRNKDLIE